MAQSHREASRRLFEVAEQQQGFFTTKQAKAAGFAENTHPYHVQVGNWVREHRGIYRLTLFPTTDRPELVLWALWSRNRNEEVERVYSHHTALSLYDLSDLNPSKLHRSFTQSTSTTVDSTWPKPLNSPKRHFLEAGCLKNWGKSKRSHGNDHRNRDCLRQAAVLGDHCYRVAAWRCQLGRQI